MMSLDDHNHFPPMGHPSRRGRGGGRGTPGRGRGWGPHSRGRAYTPRGRMNTPNVGGVFPGERQGENAPVLNIAGENNLHPPTHRQQKKWGYKKAVFGRKQHSDFTGGRQEVNMFVFRAEKGTSKRVVHRHCEKQGVPVINIKRKSHDEARFASFKLTIDRENIDRVMDEEFWPQGVGCRFYKRYRARDGQGGVRAESEDESDDDGEFNRNEHRHSDAERDSTHSDDGDEDA